MPKKSARTRLPSPKIGSFLVIAWRDAITDDGWTRTSELKEHVPIVLSCGWLVKKSSGALTLGADIDAGTASGVDIGGDSNRRVEVPRGMIVALYELDFTVPSLIEEVTDASSPVRPASSRRTTRSS